MISVLQFIAVHCGRRSTGLRSFSCCASVRPVSPDGIRTRGEPSLCIIFVGFKVLKHVLFKHPIGNQPRVMRIWEFYGTRANWAQVTSVVWRVIDPPSRDCKCTGQTNLVAGTADVSSRLFFVRRSLSIAAHITAHKPCERRGCLLTFEIYINYAQDNTPRILI